MCIKLLDCTLRDGGHINNSKFGEYAIKTIIWCILRAFFQRIAHLCFLIY